MKSAPDMFESMKRDFLTSKKLKSRMRRYWGTEWAYDESIGENVEVLKRRCYIYPDTHTKRVEMICKTFGMWNSVKDEKFKDIKKYWLFLNYKKDKITYDENKEVFINKVNNNITKNEPFEIRFGMRDPADPSKFSGMTKQELLDYLVINAGLSGINRLNTGVDGDTLTQTAIGYYVFLDGAEEYFSVEVKEAIVTPIYVPAKRKHNHPKGRIVIPAQYDSAIAAVVSVTQHTSIDDESEFATNIFKDTFSDRSKYRVAVAASNGDVPMEDVDVDEIIRANDSYSNKNNELWLDGKLRMTAFDSNIYRRSDFFNLVSNTLDTDYKVKEKGGGLFSGFLGVIIAIVIIVLAVMTGGAAAGGWAAAMGSASSFAIAIGVTGMMLSLGQIALANGGADSGVMNVYGRVVQAVSIVSMVSGIYALVTSIGNSLAAAYQEGVKAGMSTTAATANAVYATARNAVVSSVSTTAVGTSAMAQGAVAAGATLTPAASAAAAVGEIAKPVSTVAWNKVVSMSMKVVTSIVKMIEKSRVKDASREINKLSETLARTEQQLEEEADTNPNIAFGYIEWSTKNLKADNHQYEVDYLYEGTWNNIGRPSFMATGLNIRDKEYEFSKGRERDAIGQQQSFV